MGHGGLIGSLGSIGVLLGFIGVIGFPWGHWGLTGVSLGSLGFLLHPWGPAGSFWSTGVPWGPWGSHHPPKPPHHPQVKSVSHDLEQLRRLLQVARCLVLNPFLCLGSYGRSLVASVLYCALEPLAASINPRNDHWTLRDSAAVLLGRICRWVGGRGGGGPNVGLESSRGVLGVLKWVRSPPEGFWGVLGVLMWVWCPPGGSRGSLYGSGGGLESSRGVLRGSWGS